MLCNTAKRSKNGPADSSSSIQRGPTQFVGKALFAFRSISIQICICCFRALCAGHGAAHGEDVHGRCLVKTHPNTQLDSFRHNSQGKKKKTCRKSFVVSLVCRQHRITVDIAESPFSFGASLLGITPENMSIIDTLSSSLCVTDAFLSAASPFDLKYNQVSPQTEFIHSSQ